MMRAALSELLRLAWPLMLAQMAFLGMTATDTLVAGRYAATTLAGVGLGSSVVIAGFCLLMGLCLVVAPAVSRQLGAQSSREALGGWISGALALGLGSWTVLFVLLQILAAPLARWIAPEAIVAVEMEAYLRWSTWGFPFLGLFFVLRNVVEAHGLSRPVMWWGFGALALNLPLNILFIHGWGPIPAMGAAGCGLATSLVHSLLGLGLWATFRRHARTRDLRLRWGPEARTGLRETWQAGLPIGMALLAESALFALGGLLMAQYGTLAVAAHQIANTLASLAFMVQVGIGQASAILIGRAYGARQPDTLRLAAWAGALSGGLLALLLALFYLLTRFGLVGLFTTHPEVTSLAASFLVWAAAFHVFDAMQALHAAGLRGLHDTRPVMRLTLFAYSAVAVPCMAWWVFRAQAPAQSIWWSFMLGLGLASLLLMFRFWRARLPRALQEIAP
ncbi:MAG: MATE family efflux transporter [Oceanococcaceae bacterium]